LEEKVEQSKSMSRRDFLRFTGLLAGSAALAACAKVTTPALESLATPTSAPNILATSTPTTGSASIRVWMENAFLPEIDAQNGKTFNEWGQQNNVSVEFTAAATTAYRERLAASVGTDAVPAIAQNFTTLVAQYQGRNQLLPVTDLVEKLNKMGGGFAPIGLSFAHYQNEYYGVPWGLDPVMMHARTDLLKQVGASYPANWDEFRTVSKEIQTANPGVYGWGMMLGNDADTDNSFLPILWSFGGAYCNTDGSLAFKSDSMVQAIELVRKMFVEDKIIPPGAVGWDGSGNNKAYQTKQAAFICNSASVYAWCVANDAELAKVTSVYAPPAGPSGSFTPVTGWVLSIFKGTKFVDQAKAALEYYFDPARYQSMFAIGKGRLSPVYQDILNGSFYTQNEAYRDVPNMIKGGRLYSYPAPMNPAVGEMMEQLIVPEMLQKVVINNVKPEDAMNQAYEKAKPIFAKHGLG
jgi:multiple sugar transport system substrate-binding protein